ncbi:MAG: hypothetical protein ACRD3Q_12300, partial [Terriglobales bacterium]
MSGKRLIMSTGNSVENRDETHSSPIKAGRNRRITGEYRVRSHGCLVFTNCVRAAIENAEVADYATHTINKIHSTCGLVAQISTTVCGVVSLSLRSKRHKPL